MQHDFALQTCEDWMRFGVDHQPDLEGCAEERHVCKESAAAMLLGSQHTAVTSLLLD